jgi:hypothetical protein
MAGRTTRSPTVSARRCVVVSPVNIEHGAAERAAARCGGRDTRCATFARERRDAQRLSTNVRHVIFGLRKAKPDALTLRLAVCDFA